MKKILTVLILINLFAIIIFMPNVVKADEVYDEQYEGLYSDDDVYVKQNIVDQQIEKKKEERDTGLGLGDLDKYKGSSTNSDKFKSKVNNLLIIVKTVGIILSVIALAIIGIKYMIGSIEERAEYKKTMIPYLVGVFLVFSVTTIPQLIYSIVNDL